MSRIPDGDDSYDRLFERLRTHTGPHTEEIEQIASKLAKRVDVENEARYLEIFKINASAENVLFTHNHDRVLTQFLDVEAKMALFKEAASKGFRGKGAFPRVMWVPYRMLELFTACNDGVDNPKIVVPPGGWMQAFASTVFSNKTKEDVFDQIVADFRDEYCEALRANATRPRMFFVCARHWIGFVLSLAMQAAREIGRILKAFKGAG